MTVDLVVLEHVIGIGQAVGVGDERLPDVRQRVPPLSGAEDVLLEHAVAGEHAEDPLQVLGVSAGGGRADLGEDLCGGERGVGAAGPDGVGDLEADGGVERHGDADHIGELEDLGPSLVSALCRLVLHGRTVSYRMSSEILPLYPLLLLLGEVYSLVSSLSVGP